MRGCLKRVVPGIFLRQGAAKILNFAIIVSLHRYSLRLSLAFQTTSEGDYLIDDRTKNGADRFRGEHIHFGQPPFPDWPAVVAYLKERA